MIKIIFSDIDGTLLDNASALSEINQKACSKIQKEGIALVLNTGRYGQNAIAVGKMIEADINNGFVIANDGTEIWSFAQNKWIYLQQLNQETIQKLYKWLTTYQQQLILHFNAIDTLYVNSAYHHWKRWIEQLQVKIVKVNNFHDIEKPISRIMVILEKYWNVDEIKSFINKFEINFPQLTIVQYHTNVFTISKKDINKGSAIQWLCTYLGINCQNALALGDSFNDLPMFEVVGHPIVMANAHQAIKPYGKVIAPSNDNDGVAYIINHYLPKFNQ